jgi:predicted DNA-binding transcriptional regulator AlpA
MTPSQQRQSQYAADDLLDTTQVALMLGCSTRTVARYRSLGILPEPVCVPGVRRVRWPKSAIPRSLCASA